MIIILVLYYKTHTIYNVLHGVPLFPFPGGLTTGGKQPEVPAGAKGSMLRVVRGQTQGCPRHASQDPQHHPLHLG